MSTFFPAETLLIDGPDATAFAHAQFSSNVASLATGSWQFSAWLDPQGRVRALFHLARIDEDSFLLLLRGGTAASMVDALRRFVFRSKLNLTALPPRVLMTAPALPLHVLDHDGDDVSLGCDTHSLRITTSTAGDDSWRLLQLRTGWPWLPAATLNELLPATLSLQRLHAVAIDKGCYPGQEIVARLHFRGGHKRHLHHITLWHGMNAGDVLRRDGRDIGRLLDVIATDNHFEALAVISDDIAAQARDGHLDALDDDVTMRLDASWPA